MFNVIGDPSGAPEFQGKAASSPEKELILKLFRQFEKNETVDEKKLEQAGLTREEFLDRFDTWNKNEYNLGRDISLKGPGLPPPGGSPPNIKNYEGNPWLNNKAQLEVFFMMVFDLSEIQMEQILAEAFHEAEVLIHKSDLSKEKAELIIEKYNTSAQQLIVEGAAQIAAGAVQLGMTAVSIGVSFSGIGKRIARQQEQKLQENPNYNPKQFMKATEKFQTARGDWLQAKSNHAPGTPQYKSALQTFQKARTDYLAARDKIGPGVNQLDHFRGELEKSHGAGTFSPVNKQDGVSIQQQDLTPEGQELFNEIKQDVTAQHHSFKESLYQKATHIDTLTRDLLSATGSFISESIRGSAKFIEAGLKMKEGEIEANLELLRDIVELYRKDEEGSRESKQKAAQLLSHFLDGAWNYIRSKNQAIGLNIR